jgi:hypothetical protein
MPVQQIVPQVQADTSWADAIAQIGQIAASATEQYLKSKKTADHNKTLLSQGLQSVDEIVAKENLPKEQTDQIKSQIQSIGTDDPDFEKKMTQKLTPLIMWSYSGAAKKGVQDRKSVV